MQSKSFLGLISGHLRKSWFFLDQRLVIEPTLSPVNPTPAKGSEKRFESEFAGKSHRLLIVTAEKLANS